MMNNPMRLSLSIVCCLGVYALSTGSMAQAQDEQTIKKVLGLLKEANALREAGKLEPAYVKYKEAYALYPDAKIAFRLGKTAQKLGKMREAVSYYEQFLQKAPTDPQSGSVKAQVATLKRKILPRVKLTTTPAGADVYLNEISGEPIATTPKTVELKPGKVTLYFRLDGYETGQAELDLQPAQDANVTLTLIKKTSPKQTPKPEEPVSAFNWTMWGGVTAGVGGALLATGGVFSLLQSGATDDVNNFDKRAPGRSPAQARAELQALKDDAEGHYNTSLIFYSTGAVITAAGIGMLVYGLTQGGESAPANASKDAVQWHVGWTQHGGWLGLSGQF